MLGLTAVLLCLVPAVLAWSADEVQQTQPGTEVQPSFQTQPVYEGGMLPPNEQPQDASAPTMAVPGNIDPTDQPPVYGQVQPSNVMPPGPEPALGAIPTSSGLVAYKPIPESMLPGLKNSASQAPGAQAANLPANSNLGGVPAINWGPYTLGPDDVVHIAVRNQPEFTGIYAIGRDGHIQFGFVGDIEATGLTKEELAQAVEAKLKRYVRFPSVYVTILGFNSKAIYILGRVARPGKYAMRGDSIKIRDAVIAAGLVVQHAKLRRVHIVKSDPTDPRFRVIDLFKVLYRGKMQDNIDLVQGDIVVIPTTFWGGITDFLGNLLSPAGHAGSVAALAAL